MLEDTLSYKLITSLNILKSYSKYAFSSLGITQGIFVTLLQISENEGITQAKLSTIMKKDKNIISRYIDTLEEKNFVSRERIASDRRAYTLILTDKGRAAIATHQNLITDNEQKILNKLTLEERENLHLLLDKIIK